ncbi:hypothetical protein PENTCL1PPCAC_8502, partial [Pristionchus entomophagus]
IFRFSNDFTVKKILGNGANGCVFETANKFDQGEYAVKRVAVDAALFMNKYTIIEALKEVEVMKDLYHEGIVKFEDAWIEEPPVGWQVSTNVLANCDINLPLQ